MTAPVHQMIVTLERNASFAVRPISPEASILVPPENLPILSWLGIEPSKSL